MRPRGSTRGAGCARRSVVVNDLGARSTSTARPTAANASHNRDPAARHAIAPGVGHRFRLGSAISTPPARMGRFDIPRPTRRLLRDKSFAKMELDDFSLAVRVHLMGAVRCRRRLVHMRAQTRSHRLTASSSGCSALRQANYGAAKMALSPHQTLSIEGASTTSASTACSARPPDYRKADARALLAPARAAPSRPACRARPDDSPTRAICAQAPLVGARTLTLTHGIHVATRRRRRADRAAFDAISDRAGDGPESGAAQGRCNRQCMRLTADPRPARWRYQSPDAPLQSLDQIGARRDPGRSGSAARRLDHDARVRDVKALPGSDAQRPPIQPLGRRRCRRLARVALRSR